MPTLISPSVPGTYIEEDASKAISVSQGATSVPLFIGKFTPADGNPPGVITRISSWLEYTENFSATQNYSVSVAITSTVEPDEDSGEGGSDSSVKKTKKTKAGAKEAGDYTYKADKPVFGPPPINSATIQLYFQNGGGPVYIYALEQATEADKDNPTPALASLPGLIDEIDDITLLVCAESDSDYRQAVYTALLPSLEQNKGYFLLADSNSDGTVPAGVKDASHIVVYYPSVIASGMAATINDSNFVTITGYQDAKNPLGTEITTLTQLFGANKPLAIDIAQNIADNLSDNQPSQLEIPVSALMAGVYCKTDRERGVWKAPANVVLNGIIELSRRLSDEEQGPLNKAGVNVIRAFSDRGAVVWGARTQQPNDDRWRYIPVRRLFDAAERDIKKAMLPMIFEPNSQPTWKKVQAAIEHYLYSLWQQGGLAGNKPEEAWSVRIGKGITMTEEDINQGNMIVQVAMAPVKPAEFIILQFTQNMAQ